MTGLLLALLCAEVVVRLQPRLYSEGYRRSRNERLVYELYPGHRIPSLRAVISSQGLNDRHFSKEPPAEVFRIAVVGDSSSFGWKVGPEHSFPKVLERLLNTRGTPFEVMNFSVPGYNTSQEYALIEDRVLGFQPDLVVLAYSRNDTHLCNYFQPEITWLTYPYHRSFAIRYLLRSLDGFLEDRDPGVKISNLWRDYKEKGLGMFYPEQHIYPFPGLEEAITVDGDPPKFNHDVPRKYWYMLGYDNYASHLGKIQRLLMEHQVGFVSMGYFDPEVWEVHEALQIQYYLDLRDVVEEAAEMAGVLGVELDFSEYVLPDDGHLNEKGHVGVANVLYQFLEEHQLI